MTTAYKDLCIDAVDAQRLGRFWALALGLEFDVPPGQPVAGLSGPTSQHRVWINPVPEPRTVKQRMHLDVHGASVAEHVAWGATVIDADSFRWVVMTDPEGGEYCLFVRDEPPAYRLYELVVDAAEPAAIAAWWGERLEARTDHHERGFSFVSEIEGAPFESIVFMPVTEPKAVKNRVHIDVTTDDVDGLVAAGAQLLRARDDEIDWDVMADPEGNEFCAFAP